MQDPTPDRSCEALDLVETQFAWLLLWDKDHTLDGGAGLPTAGVSAFSGGASLQGPTTPRSVIPVRPCSLASHQYIFPGNRVEVSTYASTRPSLPHCVLIRRNLFGICVVGEGMQGFRRLAG